MGIILLIFSFLSMAQASCALDPWDLYKRGFINHNSISEIEKIKEGWPREYDEIERQLELLNESFEKARELELQKTTESRIPPSVHLIWLGPQPFPDESVLRLWQEHNLSYQLILWTDRVRTILDPLVEQRNIAQLFPLKLQRQFDQSVNWAEKSDILRYEILERFGGIYADADIFCRASFDPLIGNFDFFVGMETVGPFVDLHCVRLGNCLIGAIKGHPIITDTIHRIEKDWDEKTRMVADFSWHFSADESTEMRFPLIMLRTFLPFTDAAFAYPKTVREAILPAHYFGLGQDGQYKYCYHRFEASWMEPENIQLFDEDNIEIIHRTYRCQVFSMIMMGVALFLLVVLLAYLLYLRNSSKSGKRFAGLVKDFKIGEKARNIENIFNGLGN